MKKVFPINDILEAVTLINSKKIRSNPTASIINARYKPYFAEGKATLIIRLGLSFLSLSILLDIKKRIQKKGANYKRP